MMLRVSMYTDACQLGTVLLLHDAHGSQDAVGNEEHIPCILDI